MDPKKQFLAKMIDEALKAEIITLADLFNRLNGEVLAQHLPPELISSCIQEGMEKAGLAKKL